MKTEIESLKETVTKLENTNKEIQCQSQALHVENLILKKVCNIYILKYLNISFYVLIFYSIFNLSYTY